jgi:zeaxanthin glucosyltransferase
LRAAVHITHGGFASVRESIECEAPMIVVPFDADQPGNAARVVYHQLGVRAFPNQTTSSELVELCRQVYASPAYKENIHKMKVEFDRQRARQSAADLIEELLTPRNQPAVSNRLEE